MKQKLESLLKAESLKAGELTFGELCRLSEQAGMSVGAAALAEAAIAEALTEAQVEKLLWSEFSHNLMALELGLKEDSKSFLFGRAPSELAAEPLTGRPLLDKAVRYTLAAQVGNHCVGLRPCAGTGDSCPYTGLARAIREEVPDSQLVARALAIMLKLGVIFRTAKVSTGCNLEGFGAGAAAAAAAFSEVLGASPEQTGKAVTLALSPTIAVPCTPRVLVPGLCAAHIGGAVVLGWTSSWLSQHSNLPVGPPVDQMIALAVAVHPISAKEVVPTVIRYMEPFFKVNERVEQFVSAKVRETGEKRRLAAVEDGFAEVKALVKRSGSILRPFGEAVVGGSSQAVGSPANAARIAHALAKGRPKRIVIELSTELFARRTINVPAILMCGLYGSSTADATAYAGVMDRVATEGVVVEVKETPTYQLQKITIEASESGSMVETFNRGGGRLVLLKAQPSLGLAQEAAKSLGIVLIDE